MALAACLCADEQVDEFGDPLPQGAVLRLGTPRLKHYNQIYDFAYSPDGTQIASATFDRYLALWDAKTGRKVFKKDVGGAYCVDFSSDGKKLLFASNDGALKLMDIATQQNVLVLHLAGRVRAADLSPDDKFIATLSREETLELWQRKGSDAIRVWKLDGAFLGAKFAPSGTWLAAWNAAEVYRVETASGKIKATLARHEVEVEDVDISHDGALLASSGEDGAFAVWDAESGALQWRVEHAHRRAVHSIVDCVRFSPDGSTLTTAGTDSILRFWDVATHKQLRAWDDATARQHRWSPSGTHIALVPAGQAVNIRNALTGEYEPDLPGHNDRPQRIEFIAGGKRLVTVGSNSNSMCVWDSRTGEQLRRFRHPQVDGMALLGDTGRAVVSGPRMFSEYNLNTGDIRLLEMSTDEQLSIHWWPTSVSADGRKITISSPRSRSVIRDGKQTFDQQWLAELWDLEDGSRRLITSTEGRPDVKLTPDGKQILTKESRSWNEKRDRRTVFFSRVELKVRPFDDLAKERVLFVHEGEYGATGPWGWSLSPDGSLVAMGDGNEGIQLIEIATGKALHVLKSAESKYLRDFSFSRDGRRLFAGPNRWHVWDVKSGKLLARIVAGEEAYSDAAAISADGQRVVIGDREGEVSLWDVDSGRKLTAWQGYGDTVRTLVFSPDEKLLAVAGDDSSTCLLRLDPAHWPRDQAQPAPALAALWEQLGEVDAAAAYRAASQMIAQPEQASAFLAAKITEDVDLPRTWTFDDADALRLYRAAYVLEQIGGEEAIRLRAGIRRPLPAIDGTDEAIAAIADEAVAGDKYATRTSVVSRDATVAVRRYAFQNRWCDPKTAAPGPPLPLDGAPLALSRDGRFCLTQDWNNDGLLLHELASQTPLWRMRQSTRDHTVAIHSDGRRMIIGHDRRRPEMATFDLLTGKKLGSWPGVDRHFPSEDVISPDGSLKLLAHPRQRPAITVTDAKTGAKLWSSEERPEHGMRCFLSNELVGLASADLSGVRLHRARTGELVKTIALDAPDSKIYAIGPYLQVAAAQVKDGPVQIYELATQQPLFSLEERGIVAVRFLKDDVVQSLDQENAVRQWNLSQLAAPRLPDEKVEAQLTRLWPELTGDNGPKAYAAAWAFAKAGEQAVEFLEANLNAGAAAHDDEIRRLIEQLDDADFKVRQNASERLTAFGPRAMVLLRRSPLLKSSPEVKVRAQAIERVLADGTSPARNRLRWLLQKIGTPAAVRLDTELHALPKDDDAEPMPE
jgi:WD40 repeat protein